MVLPRVFVLGDSISLQYGPHLETALAGRWQYQRKGGADVARRDLDRAQGANGGDSSRVLAYLRDNLDAIAADLLLVNCGLHDIKIDRGSGARQVDPEDYRRNLQEIVSLCVTGGQALTWIRTTPCDERIHNPRAGFDRFAADVERYNAIADAVMREHGIHSCDLCACTRTCGGDEIFCDHVHFTEAVRARQAAFLAGWLDAWWNCRLRA
ncbi:MAG: SGNH/GDSL hydrolase family protein [Planctomycetota bacterium]